ncbi:MAG: hypothetical protein RH917_18595 [Lacipirellulaceae bacterium]
MINEPWYGVRLIYKLSGQAEQHYEERILVVRALDIDSAIGRAESISRQSYESETTVYVGFAQAFHIFDENGETLPEGVEVYSLVRKSSLTTDEYLDRFYDDGNECSQ